MSTKQDDEGHPARPRVSGPIQDTIRSLGHREWTATQIREALVEKYKGSHIPTIRTIRRYIKGPPDESGHWSLGASGEDDVLILPVLKDVILASHGRRRYVTKARAKYIVLVRKAAPSLPPFMAYVAATEYQHAEESNRSTAGLDAWLAFFAAGQDDEHQRQYEGVLSKGWVDSPGIIAEGEIEELEQSNERLGLEDNGEQR